MATQTLNRDPMMCATQAARASGRLDSPGEAGLAHPARVGRSFADAQPAPRTAAGRRALRRRRARVTAVRRPPSGMIPSGQRIATAVFADHAYEVGHREFRLGRWARLATTVTLLAAGVVLGVALLSPGSPAVIGQVTVAPGDSLWSIAKHAEPDADTRAVVDRIRQLNGLDGDSITAGIELRVPVVSR